MKVKRWRSPTCWFTSKSQQQPGLSHQLSPVSGRRTKNLSHHLLPTGMYQQEVESEKEEEVLELALLCDAKVPKCGLLAMPQYHSWTIKTLNTQTSLSFNSIPMNFPNCVPFLPHQAHTWEYTHAHMYNFWLAVRYRA